MLLFFFEFNFLLFKQGFGKKKKEDRSSADVRELLWQNPTSQ